MAHSWITETLWDFWRVYKAPQQQDIVDWVTTSVSHRGLCAGFSLCKSVWVSSSDMVPDREPKVFEFWTGNTHHHWRGYWLVKSTWEKFRTVLSTWKSVKMNRFLYNRSTCQNFVRVRSWLSRTYQFLLTFMSCLCGLLCRNSQT